MTAETETTRAHLHKLLEEQAALRRVATFVARGPDPAEVFERVCEEVGCVLGIEGTNLTRFETDGTQTVLAGWSTETGRTFPVRGGVTLSGDAAVPKVARTGRPARVDDYDGVEGELAEMIRNAGIASAVAAPITVAGKLWGAIVATTSVPGTFPADTEERIVGFAELVADAIANADAREQLASSRARIVAAGDSERRRLERNLHDGAQQRLVSLALDLNLARSRLDTDPRSAGEMLSAAADELELALEELRELARGLHPAILADRGLGPALDGLAGRAPLPVTVDAVPAERLPGRLEAVAYYVIAEALTNTAKHARAGAATVSVARDGDALRIEVVDDGIGGANVREGSGLRGLCDRVEALGGTLEFVSPPGEGTTVTCVVPIAAQRAGGRSPIQ